MNDQRFPAESLGWQLGLDPNKVRQAEVMEEYLGVLETSVASLVQHFEHVREQRQLTQQIAQAMIAEMMHGPSEATVVTELQPQPPQNDFHKVDLAPPSAPDTSPTTFDDQARATAERMAREQLQRPGL